MIIDGKHFFTLNYIGANSFGAAQEEILSLLTIAAAFRHVDMGWDATIPLQFWVSHSTLALPARPKSELLGFYDVAASFKNDRSSTASTNKIRTPSSWSDVWNDLFSGETKSMHKDSAKYPTSTLTIKYDFKGQSCCTTIEDKEALRLPSPDATIETENGKENN